MVAPVVKKIVALFLLSAAAAWGQSGVLDLGPRGTISIFLPDGWKTTGTDMAGQVTLTISPTTDANATATLMVTFPEQDRLDTKARLKLRLEADCRNFAEQSVEGRAIAKEFMLTSGFGFHCDFTDPELRGKPPEKGNYKVMSIGKIRLAPDVMVDVTISADGFRDRPYQELLGAIEGMEFKPGRGR